MEQTLAPRPNEALFVVERSPLYGMPLYLITAFLCTAAVSVLINPDIGHTVLFVVLLMASIPYAWNMLTAFRAGRLGIDVIAIIAILAAIVLNEYVTAGVILFMLATGESLEEYALAKAKDQLTNLLSRAPSIAHILRAGTLIDVEVDTIRVEDTLVVKPGEIIPCDGMIIEGESSVDESMITGESVPAEKAPHHHVFSGSVNVSNALTIQATRTSAESKYEQIVQLVRKAESERAPIVRLADRYSLIFTLVTGAMVLLAYFISQDPDRALAVLVVASPCPLIIATPIAVMAAISRAASRGIIVKNGGALETLGAVRTMVFDKTGTITFGSPRVRTVIGKGISEEEVLRIAGSLDQLSTHILARSLVREAQDRMITLVIPTHFQETIAYGVRGDVDGTGYLLGKRAYVEAGGGVIPSDLFSAYEHSKDAGEKMIFLSRGSDVIAAISFADELRTETADVFSRLNDLRIKDVYLLSGDKDSIVQRVATSLGINHAHGDLQPEEKVIRLKKIQLEHRPVAMVGDGVNDAPSLAASDVGIALGSHGTSAASETADIIITVDSLSRVADITAISQRMHFIALRSITVGIGVSFVLMVFATAGYISPVLGAVLQEIMDVSVIFYALTSQRSLLRTVR